VSGLALTAANYRQAIETLKKRFGCKQLIINKHMDTLLQIDAVVWACDASNAAYAAVVYLVEEDES